MSDSVFIETTIPSYFVARQPRSLLQSARQELTRRWWNTHRNEHVLYTSPLVLEEAAGGDPLLAERRLFLLAKLPVLEMTDQIASLGKELVQRGILPTVAGRDAAHIATAAVHGMDFLLTWNCRHIANAHIRKRISACFSAYGIEVPVICTPQEFLGDEDNPAKS